MARSRKIRLVEEPADALTPTHPHIHCVATPDATDVEGMNEMDRIDTEALIETLGDIALSITRRETDGRVGE